MGKRIRDLDATAGLTGTHKIAVDKTGLPEAEGVTLEELSTHLATALDESSALTAHIDDDSAAHAATAISYAGSAGLSATTVEAALDELDTERGGPGVADAQLKDWINGEPALTYTGITRDANDVIAAATVAWPDGSAGAWTTTSTHATGAITGYTVTHTASSKTVTVTVTRDSDGNATATTTAVS